MLDTIQAMSLLTVMEIIGPIILACALIYGIYHSRRRSRLDEARADAATKELYGSEQAGRPNG